MEALISQLRQDYPDIVFTQSHVASWSPSTQQVSYNDHKEEVAAWSILHEIGHALLGHASYNSDVELLYKEREAWNEAKRLASKYHLIIDNDYIEDCLDTYRDWLYKRSTCPTCRRQGLQQSRMQYRCVNCDSGWSVTTQRFCRPYRLLT